LRDRLWIKPAIRFEKFLYILLNVPYGAPTQDDRGFPRLYDGQPKTFGKPDREALEHASPEIKLRILQTSFKDKIKADPVVARLQRFHNQRPGYTQKLVLQTPAVNKYEILDNGVGGRVNRLVLYAEVHAQIEKAPGYVNVPPVSRRTVSRW